MATDRGVESSPPNLFEQRKARTMVVLQDPNLRNSYPDLSKYWLDDLVKWFDFSVARDLSRGERNALVMQFADGNLDYAPDAAFIDNFFSRFGVHITRGDQKMPVTVATVRNIVISQQVPLHTLGKDELVDWDKIPDGSSLVIKNNEGRDRLIVETNIEGISMVLDGPAIFDPRRSQIRPMLLIRIDDAKKENYPYEDPNSKRKTWKQIYGREPRTTSPGTLHSIRLINQAILQGDDNGLAVAMIGNMWRMEVLSGDQIFITPAEVKSDAVIAKPEDRLSLVEHALQKIVEYMYKSEKRRVPSLVGAVAYSISIIVELLGMTPEEVSKDGEALADLAYALEKAGIGLANDPIEQGNFNRIAEGVKATWKLPERGLTPLMYSRVEWKGQHNQPKQN